MRPREMGVYLKYLLLALAVILLVATLQTVFFITHPNWRFFVLPTVVAILFGLLLGHVAVLKRRLELAQAEQEQLVTERAWKLALQNSVLDSIGHRLPLADILTTLVERFEHRHPEVLCAFLLLDRDGRRVDDCVAPSLPPHSLQPLRAADFGTPALTGFLAVPRNIADWGAVDTPAPLREFAAASGMRTCWSQPLWPHEGPPLGVLLLCRRNGAEPSGEEQDHFDMVTRLAVLAVEHKHSDEKIVVINDQLTALIEAIPDAIFFKDGAGRWLVTNEAAKQLFQLHGCAWQGRTDSELAAARPAFRAAHESCLDDDERAWQAGDLMLFEEQVGAEDGDAYTFEVRKMPLFQPDGQRKAMVIIGRDISARRQSEQELRIAAITFESQEGMLVADADGIILRVNAAFTEQTGYGTDEVIGRMVGLLKSGRHDAEYYRTMWEALNNDGYWQGEIWNRRKGGEIYPVWLTITAVTDSEGRLTHYVGTYSDITERKEAEERIRHLAFYDPLTGLPNRRLLLDRLQHSLAGSNRSGRHGALLFIDLDNFKTLNDTQGHVVGDMLLTEVAQRLQGCVREGDTVARLGGDEFVVLLDDLNSELSHAAAQAEAVGEKIFAAVNQPYLLRGRQHHSSPSIGVSLFLGHRESSEELLKRADLAMYQAKSAGRNTIRFFDPAMQAAVEQRAEMEVDLRQALEQQQFALHYQIQLDSDGRLRGAEALLRWTHLGRGAIGPSEFVPLAEETGLILPIGRWVLETACTQLRQWEDHAICRNLKLAVNISARQFRHPEFVEQVRATLQHSGADPSRLKLELTETLVLDDIDDTVRKMSALKALGCRFSLDDFGTGYSSLAYLRRLPLDELKIDQSFVRDITIDSNDDAIVRAIIAMAHSLGLDTVAEGVETEAQRQFLHRHGCNAFQGYLFGRPLPREEFEAQLSRTSS
jgi:diguanylate cyclase (GGDEF)-like protein/PAS domain S-box-containing protein